MKTNYEQMIEAARRLSPGEIEKSGERAREQQTMSQTAEGKQANEAEDQIRKFNPAMKWVAANRQEYPGQWVCLDGDRLVSSGDDSEAVYEEALKRGLKAPLLEFVQEEETHYMGGW